MNKLKPDLEHYERLVEERVNLITNKNLFELTVRKQTGTKAYRQ